MVSLKRETGFLEKEYSKMYIYSMLPICVYCKCLCLVAHQNRIPKIFYFPETKSRGILPKNTNNMYIFNFSTL